MNSDKQKMRSEIPASDKWDLDAMYPSESGMSDDIAAGLAGAEELASMKGHIMDSPASLLRALLTYSESMRKIERAYIYSHMKRDEDNSDSHWSELFGRAAAALTAYTSLVSFFDPEILSSEPSVVYSFIREESGLEMFRFMLDHGVYLPPGPLEVDFMSIAHDDEACDKIAKTFDKFLKKVNKE